MPPEKANCPLACGAPNGPLRGKDKIGLTVGAVINPYKTVKHFTVTITDDDLTFAGLTVQIDVGPLSTANPPPSTPPPARTATSTES